MSAAGVPHKNVFGELFRCVTVLAAVSSCGVRSDLRIIRKVALSRGASVQLTSFDNHVRSGR